MEIIQCFTSDSLILKISIIWILHSLFTTSLLQKKALTKYEEMQVVRLQKYAQLNRLSFC